MNHDTRLAEIQRILVDEHGCHTVILYGSHARGDAGPASDYDLLGIKADGEAVRDARAWHGAYLDLFVEPESKVAVIEEGLLKLRGGRVLVEKDAFGSGLLQRVEAFHQAGPAPLAPDEILARKVWAEKMVARAGQGDLEAHYRRVWLLTALLEDYFRLRHQWYFGPKESFRWLEANDPETHRRYVAALETGADLESLRRLVQRVIA